MNKLNINGNNFTAEELNKIEELYQRVVQSKTENIEAEKLFLELFQGLKIWSGVNEYPSAIYYYKNDMRVLRIEKKRLWVEYYSIWRNFEYKLDMEHDEIQSFIKYMVEKHFKWVCLTPIL